MKGKLVMINVQEFLIKAMKKQIFIDPEMVHLNDVARRVLGEVKTKCVDIHEEITTQVQYKLFQKMKKDRENSVKIYTEAFEKNGSNVAKDNLQKASEELEAIDYFMLILESDMPKKLSDEETRNLVKDTIEKFGDNPNKGMIMKLFKARSDVDMATVSKFVNEFLK